MRFLPLLVIATIGPSWAGDAPSPGAIEPEAKYRSAFADYRGWQEESIKSWREANEGMHRLSAHLGHQNGSVAPATPPTKPPDGAGDTTPHTVHHHGR